ncbi:MAG: hypothetical protein QMD00_04925 [Hadesarchaea archaeon]|nr:hypothetical protein [Hadesarchaea archaeon]
MRAQIKLTPSDLKALEQLRRIALCRTSVRCPRCGEYGARLLALMAPNIIFECPECGEVWKEGE